MTKFTEGPWHTDYVEIDGGYSQRIFAANGEILATVHWCGEKTDTGHISRRKEVAQLMAAAPAMYAALEETVMRLEEEAESSLIPRSVFQALMEARGDDLG